jgi:hypothetical protein
MWLNAAIVHYKLGVFYEILGNLKFVFGEKFFFSMAAYHFTRVYMHYLKQGKKESAMQAYERLKQTKFKKL